MTPVVEWNCNDCPLPPEQLPPVEEETDVSEPPAFLDCGRDI